MSHFLFTGGGTAGHVVPALPVMDVLRAQGHRVTFVGGRSGLEERLVAEHVDAFHSLPAGKLRRYWSWANVRDVALVLVGFCCALWLLGRKRPQVVFSKGGFVTFPLVLAAWCWRIPVVAHESDRSPGLANRLAYPFVSALCVSFPPEGRLSGFRGPVLHTGSPLRPLLLKSDGDRGRALLKLPAGRPLLLVTGGSLGADRLNELVLEAAPVLSRTFAIVHVCGAGKCPPVRVWPEGYQAHEFFGHDWGDVLAAATLVLSRAGASTLFELLALGKPNVLVPLNRRASRGDQLENAEYAGQLGYSRVLEEDTLSAEALTAVLEEELAQRVARQERLRAFRVPDATARIVELLKAQLTS